MSCRSCGTSCAGTCSGRAPAAAYEDLPLYSPEQQRRHDVRPGLTGWAQVKWAQPTGMARELRPDVWYVDNVTLWLDLRILAGEDSRGGSAQTRCECT